MSRLAMASPLLAALVWALVIAIEPAPLDPGGALLAGGGLLIMATVGVVGMVVTGGRWARRLSIGVVAGGYLVASLRPVDAAWITALAVNSVAAAVLFLPAVTRHIRKLPAAAGPPPRAALIPLLLISVPFLLAMASVGKAGMAAFAVSLAALVTAFWYSRVLPGGLVAVRVIWPLVGLVMAWPLGLPSGLVSASAAVAVAVLAWTRESGVAFHPLEERGTTVPVPPELVPREVLDAADLDDGGRPIS